jgi:hypothetical protein
MNLLRDVIVLNNIWTSLVVYRGSSCLLLPYFIWIGLDALCDTMYPRKFSFADSKDAFLGFKSNLASHMFVNVSVRSSRWSYFFLPVMVISSTYVNILRVI